MLFAALSSLSACATVNGIVGLPQSVRAIREFGLNSGQQIEVESLVNGTEDSWSVYVSRTDARRFIVMQPRGVIVAKGFIPISPFMDLRPSEPRFLGGANAYIAKYRHGCSIASELRMRAVQGYLYELNCQPLAASK